MAPITRVLKHLSHKLMLTDNVKAGGKGKGDTLPLKSKEPKRSFTATVTPFARASWVQHADSGHVHTEIHLSLEALLPWLRVFDFCEPRGFTCSDPCSTLILKSLLKLSQFCFSLSAETLEWLFQGFLVQVPKLGVVGAVLAFLFSSTLLPHF